MNCYREIGGRRGVSKWFEFVYMEQISGILSLIIDVSRSHSDTTQSVVHLWSRDNPNAENST